MKDLRDWITVKRLYKSGAPIKKIAKELGMSKNTVKRLIKLDTEPKYKRTKTKSKIDSYKDKIDEWYLSEEYLYNGTRIFEELLKLNYSGSIGPIYRYLNKLKDNRIAISRKATVRFETPLGDQAQFGSPYKMVIGGTKIELYCFTMILSASRKKAIIFSKKCDADAIYQAIYELYTDLGGVTKELLIDNPKALVIKNNKDEEIKFNDHALRLSTYLGFEFNACNPYRARTKGKIEKPYQYIEEQFIKGNYFDSMTSLNRAAKEFIDKWNNKTHGTTKRIPSEHFKDEIEYLYPIRDKPFILEALKERIVTNDSVIIVDKKRYRVPFEFVNKKVKIRIVFGYKLEIYSLNQEFIISHELRNIEDDAKVLESQYPELKSRIPKSVPEIRRQFEESFISGVNYYTMLLSNVTQASYHAKEILKLKETYPVEHLDKIVTYCLEKNIYSIDELKNVMKNNYIDIVIHSGKSDNPVNNLERSLSYYSVDKSAIEEGQN